MWIKLTIKCLVLLCLIVPYSYTSDKPAFKVVVLGAGGGLSEDDLTSYLLAPAGDNNYIALDAGTIYYGIKKAVELDSFNDMTFSRDSGISVEGQILRNHIKAYLISHAHLDHVTGLIISSAADSRKTIIGIPRTIEYIRDHLFNWKVWPNFGDEGEKPNINQYKYIKAEPVKETQIDGTAMSVTPYVLSHGNDHYPSTAFLVNFNGNYLLYFGDTGPDVVEKADNMELVWKAVAPLVKEKKLKALFLESSFPNNRPDSMLYGHMTPKWLMYELGVLASLVNKESPTSALAGLPVVVTHIKPTLAMGVDERKVIKKELDELNKLGVRFIMPKQGQRLEF